MSYIAASFLFVSLAAFCLGAGDRKPVFQATVSSGWNEKVPVEFVVHADRSFVWRSGMAERKGSLTAKALALLIAHVQAANPGPRANDVGTLQVTWSGTNGKPESKVFYFPANPPASVLVKEIGDTAARFAAK